MKKFFLFILLLQVAGFRVQAEEGMWIPLLLEKQNIKQMQELGLKLSAEDIYSVNHSSLKDAIVQFGGGCTAEIVSNEGLIITNHHCGLGAIQRLSTVEHDYLTYGFWAKTKGAEIPSPGTTVTLLVRMEDVTAKVLEGVNQSMSQFARVQIIKGNIDRLEKEAVKGTHFEARIRPFYYGNQYYLFVNEVFKDVRLVGTPPSAIGQFGGDTDNWMWPRHGGDFSVFRIYADKNNKPAAYSQENVPYTPKRYLKVSLAGYEKGDFTFLFGYPGTTREYLTSSGVDLTENKENPAKIEIRQKRLDIINAAMNQSPLVRIQYTAKHQGIANAWKKMIGESRGIKRLNAVEVKGKYEMKFQRWADSLEKAQAESDRLLVAGSEPPVYSGLLPAFKKCYSEILPADMASVYLNEAGLGIEVVRFAMNFRTLVKASSDKNTPEADVKKSVETLQKVARGFYKDYQPAVDEKIMAAMLESMNQSMEKRYLPTVFQTIEKEYHNIFSAYSSALFRTTLFADSVKLYLFLKEYKAVNYKKLQKDPAYQLAESIFAVLDNQVFPSMTKFNAQVDSLQRLFMAAQMEMQKERRFYPDANSTLRVSYGKVADYYPADAVHYNHFTTSAGILQKEDSTVYDLKVDKQLKQLLQKGDFGRYADKDGTLHIAFTGSNHTTGGMSGSPVLNGKGELIGLNFDRNWEGTMSDLMYDPSQCRNITLDIRYCLFLIDKYAGADNLMRELTVVE